MFSSSRGILYTAPPADDETREKRSTEAEPAAEAAESGEPTPETNVEDTSPATSDANWTGSVHADD